MLAHSNVVQAASLTRVPPLSCAVAFDTGYAGSNGLEPQSWVNGNGTSYIYFGSGEFDGQGSGHDFYGTDWSHNNRYPSPAHHQGHDHAV